MPHIRLVSMVHRNLLHVHIHQLCCLLSVKEYVCLHVHLSDSMEPFRNDGRNGAWSDSRNSILQIFDSI